MTVNPIQQQRLESPTNLFATHNSMNFSERPNCILALHNFSEFHNPKLNLAYKASIFFSKDRSQSRKNTQTVIKIMKWEQGRNTHISIELPDEAGKVIVLEILGQKVPCELGVVPHHEAIVSGTPGHHVIGGWVVHHVVGFVQKRRYARRVDHRRRVFDSLHFCIAKLGGFRVGFGVWSVERKP